MYADEVIKCTDCNAEFPFTSGEQKFFAEKGFSNKPNRCPDCRAARKAQRGDSGSTGNSNYAPRAQIANAGPREMHDAVCTTCGKETKVPFVPNGTKPIFCRDCFKPRPQFR